MRCQCHHETDSLDIIQEDFGVCRDVRDFVGGDLLGGCEGSPHGDHAAVIDRPVKRSSSQTTPKQAPARTT
jgi:hypothetical protein